MVKKSSFLEKLFARKKSAPQKPESLERGASRVDPARDLRRGSERIGEPVRIQPAKLDKPRVIEARKAAPNPQAKPQAKPAPSVEPAKAPKPEAPEVQKAAEDVARARKLETPGNAHDKVRASQAPAPSSSGPVTRILGGKSREDAAQALTEGFRELGSLLHGIHERMDSQGRQSSELNQTFAGLPDMAKAQVDFMAKVSQQLVEQREKTGELLEKLGGLPELLDGIHKTLERTAAVEERTEKNLRDFRTTMDRIHTSIGELSSQNTAAMAKATESLERTNTRTTQVFEESQQKAYEAFQKSQEQGLAELSKVVERSSRSNRGITWMLALLCVAIVVLTVVLVAR